MSFRKTVNKVHFKDYVTIQDIQKAEQRDILNDIKKEKAKREQALSAAHDRRFKELRELAAQAEDMIKLYRTEEHKFIDKLKEIQQLAQNHAVSEPIKTNTVKAERDQKRLLQLAHVWLCRARAWRQSERLKLQEKEPIPSPRVSAFTVPKLEVPSRRQSLNS